MSMIQSQPLNLCVILYPDPVEYVTLRFYVI